MTGRLPQPEAAAGDARRISPRALAAVVAAIAAFEGTRPEDVRVAAVAEAARGAAGPPVTGPSLWALSGRLAQMAARRELWAKRRG